MIKSLLKIIGLDRAILYTSSARIIQSFGSLITLVFIFKTLNLFEQGYFFTFSSILALRLFFELGINNIIIQFTAHESSNIELGFKYIIIEKKKSSKLFSIFQLIIKYYSKLTIFFILFIYTVGQIYFGLEDNYNVSWKIPWLLICLNAGMNFFISPFFAFFEGLGLVKEISFLRLIQTIISLFLTWTLLNYDARLYAAPIASIIALLVLYKLFYSKYNKTIRQCLAYNVTEAISYRYEIFPLQWKLAISWIAGYFIFQIFNPLVFKFSGPELAAKMGTTLSILNSILFISISWIQTKTPLISKYISQKKYFELDQLFNKSIIQSISISVLLTIILNIINYFVEISQFSILGLDLHGRFLGTFELIFISVSFIFNNYLGGLAIYLRSHKVEPLLLNSITFAILVSIGCTYFIKHFDIREMLLWYMIVSFMVSIWGTYIYIKFKKKYH